MTTPDETHDRIAELRCGCCGHTVRISRANMRRLATAVRLRFPNGDVTLAIDAIPADIDLTGDVTAKDIARIASHAIRGNGPT